MILQPTTVAELTQSLASAFAKNEKIAGVDLTSLGGGIEHIPEDMTVTVGTGVTLAALQKELASHRQWLPIDPPHSEKLTIADLINSNPSGPRRFGYGTVRDHLIGIAVAMADGTVVHSGGKVVKNVAGYDLLKLFVGARGSLGVPIEATFKLRPLPDHEQFVEAQCASLEQVDGLIEAVLKSPITPVVLDLHNSQARGPVTLVLGFAGTREEVYWQLARAVELGFGKGSSLEHCEAFWANNATAHRLSVLPSKIMESIRGLNGVAFVARAGNGVIYHRGKASPPPTDLPLELMRRLKDTFDPRSIFPELPS